MEVRTKQDRDTERPVDFFPVLYHSILYRIEWKCYRYNCVCFHRFYWIQTSVIFMTSSAVRALSSLIVWAKRTSRLCYIWIPSGVVVSQVFCLWSLVVAVVVCVVAVVFAASAAANAAAIDAVVYLHAMSKWTYSDFFFCLACMHTPQCSLIGTWILDNLFRRCRRY